MSTRSPSPQSPASVSALPPMARPRRVSSAKPRVIKRGARAVAKLAPVRHAAGDGDDVLHRAADFRADQIVGYVGAEGRQAQAGDDALRRAPGRGWRWWWRSAGRGRRPWQSRARKARRGSPCGISAASTSVIRARLPRSTPLAQSTIGAAGLSARGQRAQHRAHVLGRRNREDQLGPGRMRQRPASRECLG